MTLYPMQSDFPCRKKIRNAGNRDKQLFEIERMIELVIQLRLETEKDYRKVENLTREAFWDVYKPGCDEHLVLHNLRKSPAFIPELNFVAMRNGEIVGSIVYSRAKVVDRARKEHEVLTFGPISVLPSCQRQGIGSRLIEHTKALAADLGCKAVVIFGNPAFYHRFGFRNAADFSIATAEGENFDAFMALELYEGALKGISGRFYEDPVFHVDPKELESFEKNFPPKEKHVTDTQLK